MREAGTVVKVVLSSGSQITRHRGYGACEFADEASAQRAIRSLNGRIFHGNTLRVAAMDDEAEAQTLLGQASSTVSDQDSVLALIMALTPQQIAKMPEIARAKINELRASHAVPPQMNELRTKQTVPSQQPGLYDYVRALTREQIAAMPPDERLKVLELRDMLHEEKK